METQTSLRATSVAIGRIYAMHVMRPKTTRNPSLEIDHSSNIFVY